jgi:flagellar biosynthesis protein FlhB
MSEVPDRNEKTHAASPKRKRDAAAKGDVTQSRDLATALVMLGGATWLALAGPWCVDRLRGVMRTGLMIRHADIDAFDPWSRVMALGGIAAGPVFALFGIGMLAVFAGPPLLGSFGFRASAFAPKPRKLNPLAGLSRMFGAQGVMELGKSMAKVTVLGGIGWWLIAGRLPMLMHLSAMEPDRAASAVGEHVVAVFIAATAGLVMIGMIDGPLQMIRRAARLRMTHQEAKQENRETEGSPETKQIARQRRHDILSSSARRAVGEATMVLTNPTHFAVALRYRPGIDAVPIVVARGRGDTALAIKALARDATVPTLEYPQLTRAIYFTARSGQPIASDLYIAVATILAFIFNLDRAMAGGIGQPEITVPDAKRFDAAGQRNN